MAFAMMLSGRFDIGVNKIEGMPTTINYLGRFIKKWLLALPLAKNTEKVGICLV
jgi:hypothetical protein